MDEDGGQGAGTGAEARSSGKTPSSGKKNTQALSAALRANLARRKVRERALRAQNEAAGGGDEVSDGEAKWTK